MTAALQFASASGHPIILHYRAEAGHTGEPTADATIDQNADDLAFLFRELDVISDGEVLNGVAEKRKGRLIEPPSFIN